MQPLDYVSSTLHAHPNRITAELSVYTPIAESVAEHRITHPVPFLSLKDRFLELTSQLNGDQEIAIHSRIQVHTGSIAECKHFGLVDFKTPTQALAEDATAKLMVEYDIPSAALFLSGKSFHLYLG